MLATHRTEISVAQMTVMQNADIHLKKPCVVKLEK